MSELTPPKRRTALLSSVIAALVTAVGLHLLLFRGAGALDPVPDQEGDVAHTIAELSPLSDSDFSSALETALRHSESYGTHHPGEDDSEFYDRLKADCLWDFATRLQNTGAAAQALAVISEDELERVGTASVEQVHNISADSVTLETSVGSTRSGSSEGAIELGTLLITVVDDRETGNWLVSGAALDPDFHDSRELP